MLLLLLIAHAAQKIVLLIAHTQLFALLSQLPARLLQQAHQICVDLQLLAHWNAP